VNTSSQPGVIHKKFALKIALLVLAAVIVIAIAGWWLTRQPEQPKWVTVKVDQGAVVQRVSANGTLNPVELVNVGTQISGTVMKLYTDFNRPVKAGQLLAELDPALLEAQIRQTEANLAGAKANLNNAELILKRNENLKARGFVSDGALDGFRKDLESARAQVLQVEAQLMKDQTNLGYSKVRSPIDGIVVSRGIDVGQTVAASFQTPTLFQIARDLRRMQIDTSVSEADVGSIQTGQPVRFTVDSFREQDFNAKVRMVRLNPTSQQNVVTYNVVIDVDNKDGILLPGMTAQVSIMTNRKDNVVRVPAAALRFRPPESAAPPQVQQVPSRAARVVGLLRGHPRSIRSRLLADSLRKKSKSEFLMAALRRCLRAWSLAKRSCRGWHRPPQRARHPAFDFACSKA
jgi:HlyD family secretion protein